MAVRSLRCRYCGEECEPRTGRPGYINAHEECHGRWGDGDVEMVVASLSDEDGSWTVVTKEMREREIDLRTPLRGGRSGALSLHGRLAMGLLSGEVQRCNDDPQWGLERGNKWPRKTCVMTDKTKVA